MSEERQAPEERRAVSVQQEVRDSLYVDRLEEIVRRVHEELRELDLLLTCSGIGGDLHADVLADEF